MSRTRHPQGVLPLKTHLRSDCRIGLCNRLVHLVVLHCRANPGHALIERMADTNSIMAGGFDREQFKAALLASLAADGWNENEAPKLRKRSPTK